MQYLLDTNIFLWWLNGDKKLKPSMRAIIENSQNTIYVSIVTAWEISIKHKIGKIRLKTSLRRCFEVSPFEILTLNLEHIFHLDKLPLIHKDPFDRIILAQSQVENVTLLTGDKKIRQYSNN